MEIEKTFHMKEGVDGASYSKNSFVQKKASDAVKFMTLETAEQIYVTTAPRSFGIADLGCSSGNNALSNIREIVTAIEGISRKVSQPAPEFRVYLNDLPTNDFNTLFKALPGFHLELKNERSHGDHPTLYIGGYPGSFYGRLFPDNSLHFIYSNASVHWLSKIPPGLFDEKCRSINKGSVYITKYSPPEAHEAYARQFQEDFTLFLHSRSKELVSGGGMMLILSGRQGPNHIDRGISFLFEIFSRALSSLVNKGDIEQEKLDSYDVHFYAPSQEELEDLIRKAGSLKLDRLESFETDKIVPDGKTYGKGVAMSVRAVQESMLSHHFGDAILDDLFEIYGKMMDEELAKEDIRPIYYVVVLRKI